jgi:hypothetical protein
MSTTITAYGDTSVDEIAHLYQVADDHEAALLDDLRRRAGLTWDCEACEDRGGWTNLSGDSVCGRCGEAVPS